MSSISSSSSFTAPVAKRPAYSRNGSSVSRSYVSRAYPSASRYQRSGWLSDPDSSDSDSDLSSYTLSKRSERSERPIPQRQFTRPRHLRYPIPPLLGGKGGGGRYTDDAARWEAQKAMDEAQKKFDNTNMNAAFYQGLAACLAVLATLFLLLAWQIDAIALLTLPTKGKGDANITVAISDSSTSIPDSFLATLQRNSFIAFVLTWQSIIGASFSLLATLCICYGRAIRNACPAGLKASISGHIDRAPNVLLRILNGSHDYKTYGSFGIMLWWIFFLGLPAMGVAAFHALAFLDQMRTLQGARGGDKVLQGRITYGLSTLFACVAGTLVFLASLLSAASQCSKAHIPKAREILDKAADDPILRPSPPPRRPGLPPRKMRSEAPWQDDLQADNAPPPQYQSYNQSSYAVPMQSEASYPAIDWTINSRKGSSFSRERI